jgi:hypothetical protein
MTLVENVPKKSQGGGQPENGMDWSHPRRSDVKLNCFFVKTLIEVMGRE